MLSYGCPPVCGQGVTNDKTVDLCGADWRHHRRPAPQAGPPGGGRGAGLEAAPAEPAAAARSGTATPGQSGGARAPPAAGG